MSAALLDGKLLADNIKLILRQEAANLKKTTQSVPVLANVMIGEDPSAAAYANSQKKVAQYIGLDYRLVNLPIQISQKELLEQIDRLNRDPHVSGIMIYKPVPSQIDYRAAVNHIAIAKDLEGTNVANMGQLILGGHKIIPCTAAAVMEHIKSTSVDLPGKEAVVIGRSEIVGKPVSLLLLEQRVTVTICHQATSQAGKLAGHVARADILVAAAGKAGFIKGEWVKEGAIVIDVGINKAGDTIQGDVEFDSAKKRASYITPVPGGVGPVTVVMLMKNGIEAFKMQTDGSHP